MARPRKPTNILELNGSFKHNPDRKRARENEPQTVELGKPPKHLSAEHKKTWREIVRLVPEGIIAQSDALALEMLSALVYQMRTDFDCMTPAKLTRLETLLGKFGMTPSDRSKVTVTPKKDNEPNPWDEF